MVASPKKASSPRKASPTKAASPKKSTPKKSAAKKRVGQAKKPAAHPKYIDMIMAAVAALKERTGSSRQAISKYITSNYKIGESTNVYLKMALKRGVTSGLLNQVKGTGASGSFKLTDKAKKASTKPAKKVVKRPATKKVAPKKKKATPKKKKPTKGKTPKKAVAPAKKRTPKKTKKPAAKKPTAKKAVKKMAPKKKSAITKKVKK